MAWKLSVRRARGSAGDGSAGAAAPGALPARGALERRWLIAGVAAVLFGVIFALRQASTQTDDSLALLYVIPIALIALEYGLRGGAGAALLAFGLLELWMASSSADLDSLAVGTRVTVFVVVGAVAGQFSDRMRAGNARQRRLLNSGLALAELSPDADPAATLAAQVMRVVPASAAQVQMAGGAAQPGEGPPLAPATRAVDHAGAWEEVIPIVLRGTTLAAVTVSTRHKLTSDDRAALEIFALQGALTVENRRLLEHERERAVMRAELNEAQARLLERGDQLQAVVARQEAERGEVARELHDDAAQVLAAVLLDLKTLERQLGQDRDGQRWEMLRENVEATLQTLRSLAVGLRPPILRLGLQAALEDLGDAARRQGFGRFVLDLACTEDLPAELETVIYRIVEEVLAAVGPAREVVVASNDAGAIVITVANPEREIDGDRLTILKARLEIAQGAVSLDSDTVRVIVPLPGPVAAAELPALQ